MSIIDDIGRGAGELGRAVAQKSVYLANVAKIKLSIMSEEDKIRQGFGELGKLCYRDRALTERGGEEYEPLFAKIDAANEKIAGYNAELERLRREQEESAAADAETEPVVDAAPDGEDGEKPAAGTELPDGGDMPDFEVVTVGEEEGEKEEKTEI